MLGTAIWPRLFGQARSQGSHSRHLGQALSPGHQWSLLCRLRRLCRIALLSFLTPQSAVYCRRTFPISSPAAAADFMHRTYHNIYYDHDLGSREQRFRRGPSFLSSLFRLQSDLPLAVRKLLRPSSQCRLHSDLPRPARKLGFFQPTFLCQSPSLRSTRGGLCATLYVFTMASSVRNKVFLVSSSRFLVLARLTDLPASLELAQRRPTQVVRSAPAFPSPPRGKAFLRRWCDFVLCHWRNFFLCCSTFEGDREDVIEDEGKQELDGEEVSCTYSSGGGADMPEQPGMDYLHRHSPQAQRLRWPRLLHT